MGGCRFGKIRVHVWTHNNCLSDSYENGLVADCGHEHVKFSYPWARRGLGAFTAC